MTKSTNKLYRIEDNIYGSELGVFIGSAEKFNNHLKNLGIPEDFYAEGSGKYIMYKEISLIWIPELEDIVDIGVLIHELLHHCMAVFAGRGIPIESDNDEVMCYYQAMMFKNICKQLKIKGIKYDKKPRVSTKTKK